MRVKTLATFLLGCLPALAGTQVAAQEIKIGVAGPITGPLAFIGQHIKWAGDLAVDEVNRSGGVLGRRMAFLMQDSACRPADAVASGEKLLSQDNVDAMLGDVCSGATLALMPVVEKAQRPLIVTISTHPDITQRAGKGGNPWVFRTVPHDGMIATVVADKMKSFRSIAIVGEDTDYGRGAVRLLKERLPASVRVISEDYMKQSETDFLPILTRIRASKPDAIGTYVLDQQAFNLMKQYLQFGLRMPLVGRPPLGSAVVAPLVSSGKFDGSWTVYPYYDKFSNAKNDAFTKAYVQRYKQPPHYAGYGVYEGVKIVADAIRRAGSTDAGRLREALEKTSYDAILGPMRFDEHHQAHARVMYMVVEGGAVKVKELVEPK
ncbi:MAG TPA: ABC transporter substrate-binding protein [Gammaproteobacteria bacterium]|nr:ABC transporter substrate-binding protein [Gammaproteobacteria bacterium]